MQYVINCPWFAALEVWPTMLWSRLTASDISCVFASVFVQPHASETLFRMNILYHNFVTSVQAKYLNLRLGTDL